MKKRASPDNGKIIRVNPNIDEGSEQLYTLTTRQAGLLLQITEYLLWKNRYREFPDEMNTDDKLDAYISDLRLRLMMTLDLCNAFIDCIETDDDTKAALKAYILNLLRTDTDVQQEIVRQSNGNSPNASNFSPYYTYNLVPDHYGCDTEKIARSIDTLVDWMNVNNGDFLQKITTAGTPADRSAVLSKNIPNFTGSALVGGVSEAVSFLSGALYNNYNSFYDTTYADALKCELYRIASCNSSCTITSKDIELVFMNRLNYHP